MQLNVCYGLLSVMTLRIGHIDYLNCVPFFRYPCQVSAGDLIVRGSPARLNALLADGQIDLCPASSFEYGRNWRDYLLLPDLSISSFGAVKSVLLFAVRPLKELARLPIAVTGESATSIHLLQILLHELSGVDALHLYRPEASVEEVIRAGGSGLLIGDRALKAAKEGLAPYILDLGELWHVFSGLPFVFALWMVRREVAAAQYQEVACFQRCLQDGLARALSDLPLLARQTVDRSGLELQELVAYWCAMSYRLTDVHQQGLRRFFQLAVQRRLLPAMPELHFFPDAFSIDGPGLID